MCFPWALSRPNIDGFVPNHTKHVKLHQACQLKRISPTHDRFPRRVGSPTVDKVTRLVTIHKLTRVVRSTSPPAYVRESARARQAGNLEYRGTSPIRNRPPPQDPLETLGIGLR